MKLKMWLILSVLVLWLAACAPAQAPEPELVEEVVPATTEVVEVPAEAPVVEPTKRTQLSGMVVFHYEYTDVIPQEWVEDFVESERIVFSWKNGEWSTEKASPTILDMGPLFDDMVWQSLTNVTGNCGINTYYSGEPLTKGEISFQPVCDEISEIEEAKMIFGLENCDRDEAKNLVCSKPSDKGTLYYQLNPDLNKFQFTYSGIWDFRYESWMRDSLAKLEFQAFPDNFFDSMIPGASYTHYKE